MIRGIFTISVMSLMVVIVGVPTFIAGLIHPSRRLFAFAARKWSAAILRSAGVRLVMDGWQRPDDTPRFYVANHQSALDIPIIISALEGDVRLMAKDTLFRIPIFGAVMRRYGFVPIERQNARRTYRNLDKLFDHLRKHPVSFAAFPEGTRSRDGRLLPFRPGNLKIAQRTGLDIVPVVIDGSVRVSHRDNLRAVPGLVRVTFMPPIPAARAAEMSSIELRNVVVEIIGSRLGARPRPPAQEPNELKILGAEAF